MYSVWTNFLLISLAIVSAATFTLYGLTMEHKVEGAYYKNPMLYLVLCIATEVLVYVLIYLPYHCKVQRRIFPKTLIKQSTFLFIGSLDLLSTGL